MDDTKRHPNTLHQNVSEDIAARQGSDLQQPQTEHGDDPVKTVSDERHPNVPGTAGADHGPIGADPGGKAIKGADAAHDEK